MRDGRCVVNLLHGNVKRVSDLPGFNAARSEALRDNPSAAKWMQSIASARIPGLTQISSSLTLQYLLALISCERAQTRSRLRLVPASHAFVANDCEAP